MGVCGRAVAAEIVVLGGGVAWQAVCCWALELQGGNVSESMGPGRELVGGVGSDTIEYFER